MKKWKTMGKQWLVVCSVVVSALVLSACGTQSEVIAVKRPAEIELVGIKKVVVGQIQPRESRETREWRAHGNDFADAVVSRLARSNRFEVLDRENLGALLREKGLSDSNLSDHAVQLRLFGPSAFISGRVSVDEYRPGPVERFESKDKSGRLYVSYQQKATYNFAVEVRVTDVRTGKILATKTASGSASGQTPLSDNPNLRVDDAVLYRSAMESAADSFMRMIDQHVEQVRLQFQTDKDLPEADQAIAQFRLGQYAQAIELLSAAVSRPGLTPVLQAKALYDLGVVQTYAGQYAQAEANLKQAYTLKQEQVYLEALGALNTERAQAAKLQSQNQSRAAENAPPAAASAPMPSAAPAAAPAAASAPAKTPAKASTASKPASAAGTSKPKTDVKF